RRDGESGPDELARGLRHGSEPRTLPRRRDLPDLRPARRAQPSHAEELRLRRELRRAARARPAPHRRRDGEDDHAVSRSGPRARDLVARPQLRGVRPLVLLGAGADLAQSLLPARGYRQRPPRHTGDGGPASLELPRLALPDALDLRKPDGCGEDMEG